MKFYLVGIKGSGMSALACYLYDLGNIVIGSDYNETFDFERGVIKRNIQGFTFSKNNLDPNYIYIIGNAYRLENEEVQEIIKNGYKYYYYHEYISTLPGTKIAVCGTHGKTTTSYFLKELLKDEDIACIIGDGTGYAKKNYKYLIFEACEYQDHFLSYRPDILLITNNYSKVNINNNEFIINIPGIHNLYNFLLCYKTLKLLGFTDEYIKNRANKLNLPTRRMQEYKYLSTVIIEDYGHHPTEIKALYEMLNIKYKDYKKVVIFQPHTYSRTLSLITGFIESLNLFDDIYIDKVFTSIREPYSVEKEVLVEKKFSSFKKYKNFDKQLIGKKLLIVLLGAGNINKRFKEAYFIDEKI